MYIDTLFSINGLSLFDYFSYYNVKKDIVSGLDPYPPYIGPLNFNEDRLRKIPKIHIRCTKSEFIEISSKLAKI